MAILKKHLTPLMGKPRGQIDKHVGKGSTVRPLPGAAGAPSIQTINDYAKATPLANPSTETPVPPGD
jgi:hypothetical protein